MSNLTNAEIMANIERLFVCKVGVWNDDGECVEIFGDVCAGTLDEAIAAFPACANNPRASAMPVHYIGKDGEEYDFR